MKTYFLPILIAAVLFASCSGKKIKPYYIEQAKISNLKLVKTTMLIDQNYGARIISLRYHGKEILVSPKMNVQAFGSTLWVDPQSTWKWPPYGVLDCDPYSLSMNGTQIQFLSEPDKKSGFQIGKYFRIGKEDTTFKITYYIKNISDDIKSAGPWEVTRVPAGGLTFYPAATDSAIMKLSDLPGVEIKNGIVWYNYNPALITKNCKLFGMGQEGWLAHLKDSVIFIKAFKDLNMYDIAPGQGEIEIYANGAKDYLELENHGEHVELTPGDSVTYDVKWIIKTVPKNIDKSAGSTDLVYWVRKLVFNL